MAKPAAKGAGRGESKRPAHRPPFEWTYDIEAEILTRIMKGESVHRICGPDRDDWLPSESTFYARLAMDAEFSEKYARARVAQGHREADEIRDIADLATPEDVQVARLKIDARKWRASKLAPKVYGEKQTVDHKSSDGTMTPKDGLPDELVASLDAIASKLSGSDGAGEVAGNGEADAGNAAG